MSDDLFDVDDDFWNHPSLLQYATITSSSTSNTTHQPLPPPPPPPLQQQSIANQNGSRKRKFDAITMETNPDFHDAIHTTFKRPRITSDSNSHSNNTQHAQPQPQPTPATTHNQTNDAAYTYQFNASDYSASATTEIAPECNHKLPMVKRTVRKNNANFGRAFWTCAQSSNQCKAFKWDDQFQRELKIMHKKNSASTSDKNNGFTLANYLKRFVISTELMCVDPLPLVEVTVHPPQPPFIDAIKACKNASWNDDKKKWIIPLSEHNACVQRQRNVCTTLGYTFNMDVIPQPIIANVTKWMKHNAAAATAKQDDDECSDEAGEWLNALPLRLRTALYDFQKQGFAFAIRKNGRCLIADQMGLGKSIQAIAIAYYYRNDWPLLVVVPSSLTLTWKIEILKWLKGCVREGDINMIKKTTDKLLDFETNQPLCAITIMSYNLAVRKQAEIYDRKHLFGMIICDESHALKNHATQRCKVLCPLIRNNIRRALLLSGTPTNNRPSELHTQIDALRPNEFMSYKKFTLRYCEGQQSKFGWQAIGAIHLQELHAIISHRVMIRRNKKEVLSELPDKIRTVVNVECDKSTEKKIAKKLSKDLQLKDAVREIEDNVVDGDKQMSPNSKNAVFDRKNKNMLELYALTGESKIAGIKTYVTDLFESGEKFLIFSHHKNVMNEIEQHVKNKCKTRYIRIDGGTNTDSRQLLVDEFQKNEKIRIAILSITAAGIGLTLTAATSVVFAELYWSPTILLQCEDRAHRISQKSVVTVVYLLGAGSLDDKMWPMLKKKMEVISQTVSGKQQRLEVERYTNHYIKQNKNSASNSKQEYSDTNSTNVPSSAGKKQRTITSMLTPISKKT